MPRYIPACRGSTTAPISLPAGLRRSALLNERYFSPLEEVEPPEPLEVCALPRCDEETTVVGLDTTALTLGECESGAIVAVRAAMVTKARSTKYRAKRFGPMPFLIPFISDQDHSIDPMSLLEACIKDYVSGHVSNSIILWDGRLQLLEGFVEGLECARRNGNVIIALSKDAISHHHPLYEKIRGAGSPFVAILSDDRSKSVVAAQLEAEGLVFKAECFPSKGHEEIAQDFARIVGNDLLGSGYPETLRLAHILCKFTATEVIGLRQAVLDKTSIAIRRKNDARRILFGGLWG
jgi:hypothetical protein